MFVLISVIAFWIVFFGVGAYILINRGDNNATKAPTQAPTLAPTLAPTQTPTQTPTQRPTIPSDYDVIKKIYQIYKKYFTYILHIDFDVSKFFHTKKIKEIDFITFWNARFFNLDESSTSSTHYESIQKYKQYWIDSYAKDDQTILGEIYDNNENLNLVILKFIRDEPIKESLKKWGNQCKAKNYNPSDCELSKDSDYQQFLANGTVNKVCVSDDGCSTQSPSPGSV